MTITIDLYVFVIALIIKLQNRGFNDSSDSLQLVHVVFRHGQRTQLDKIIFLDDPHVNDTYFPYGFGGLTNEGKIDCYNLGLALKQKYGQFLGNVYHPDLVDAVSSGSPRCSMSVLALMAGLFPPKGTPLEWNKDLNWQPTIYRDLLPHDKLLASPFNNNCTTFHSSIKGYLKSEEGKNVLKTYTNIYAHIQKKTETNFNPFKLVVATIDILFSRKKMNFNLPSWSEDIFFQLRGDPIVDFYIASSKTSKLKQITGGFLLKKILHDTKLKLNDKLLPSNRMMFLYSAHDTTVFYLLSAMNIMLSRVPDFSSCAIVEVHRKDHVDSIRVLYGNSTELNPMVIPGCTEFCPMKKFIQIVKDNIPGDDLCKENPECC